MEPVLKVRNLTTKLKLADGIYKVVDDLSFDLYHGKTLALVGESGSGKTMSALSLLRILPTPPALPPEGEVIFKNRNLLSLSNHEMRKVRGADIAMIFQDPMSALNPVLTIGEQLLEVAELHLNLYGDEAVEKAVESLKLVGIVSPRERLYNYPHQLSGGMKQRVMIAMALMCEPDVLIADEPTTALDVTIQAQVLDLMRHLQKKLGMAILLITHDMGVVAEMADEVVVMYATQSVEQGSARQIFDLKSHPYTEGLFNSLPSETEPKKRLNVIKGTIPPITNLPNGCHFHPRCPYVMDICLQGEVPNFPAGQKEDETRHTAKCWLYDKNLMQERDVL
jgi:oligopeptide/dipeptide ABC transporter ATP-binding protein